MNWINIKDKLPEYDKRVLTCNLNKEYYPEIAFLNDNSIINEYYEDSEKIQSTTWFRDNGIEIEVTHWMSLPMNPNDLCYYNQLKGL